MRDFVHRVSAPWVNNQFTSQWIKTRLDVWNVWLKRGISMVSQPIWSSHTRNRDEAIDFCDNGELDRALNIIMSEDQQGSVLSVSVYRNILKECTRRKSLVLARRVSVHLAKQGLESRIFLAEYLVSTLVKCGGLQDALQIFHKLRQRSAFSWTAIVSGYTMCGQGRDALNLYKSMKVDGVCPNAYTFVSLLKACSSIADLQEGKHIHLEAMKYRCLTDLYVSNCLIEMYSKCGSLVDAWNVFATLPQRDVVTWTVMVTAYAQHGLSEKALLLYQQMQEEGVTPNARTFVSAIQACGMLADKEPNAFVDGRLTKVKSLETAKAIHLDTKRKGYDSDAFVGSALIHMYGKCRSPENAQYVFYMLSTCDVVAWNAMLVSLIQGGQLEQALHLYEQMLDGGVIPNHRTFVTVLQACGMLAEEEDAVDRESPKVNYLEIGRAIHDNARKFGCDKNVFVANTLVSMYGKCQSTSDAQAVFGQLYNRGIVSWNAMIGAYGQQRQGERVLLLYAQMKMEGANPDAITFTSALHACRILAEEEDAKVVDGKPIKVKALRLGNQIHSDATSTGYESQLAVGMNLICMYGKCGEVENAQNVFNRMSQRDVGAWTSILAAYVEQGQADKALELYHTMCNDGVSPNSRTFVSVIQACGVLAEQEEYSAVATKARKLKWLENGRAIHACAQVKGYSSDHFVASALMSMYSKCGSIVDAWGVFDEVPHRDAVLWNAMLTACVEEGLGEKALQIYEEMQEDGMSPNEQTFVSLLQACGMLADLEEDVMVDGQFTKIVSLGIAKALHANAQVKGFDSDSFVANTIISTYGKCGSISYARSAFEKVCEWNLVSWNTMLATYVQHGQAAETLQLYMQLHATGMSPDARTLVSALQACGILAEKEDVMGDREFPKFGSLAVGKALHVESYRRGYCSDVFVCSSLVTMYGKCRCIKDARDCLDRLFPADMVACNAMLSAYVEQGQAEAALELFMQIEEEAETIDAMTFLSTLQACYMLAENEEDTLVDGRPIRLKSLAIGKLMHADIQSRHCNTDDIVGSMLIRFYGRCGSIEDAYSSFSSFWPPDVVAWNAILTAYVEQGTADKAMELYGQMREQGVSPNKCTFQVVLEACRILVDAEKDVAVKGLLIKAKSLEMVKAIHAALQTKGYDLCSIARTNLLGMYGKCGSLADVQNLLSGLPQRDVVVWNRALVAYVEHGQFGKALGLYEQMRQESVSPDRRTLMTAIKACGVLAEKSEGMVNGWARNKSSLEIGKEIHLEAQRKGYDTDVHVGSALVDLYSKCGSIVDAQSVFDRLPKQGVVCWNAMLMAFVEQGKADRALELYIEMQEKAVTPNSRTCVIALQACGILGAKRVCLVVNGRSSVQKTLTIGKEIHADVLRMGFDSDVYVGSALINMYGKYGCIEEASNIFAGLPHRDVALWNAMLMAFVSQNQGGKALQLYERMRDEDFSPNDITIMCMLQACSNIGSLEMVRELHQTVASAGNDLSPFIASALISAYGRCGSIEEGKRVFDALPQRNLVVWNAVIAGYCRHGDSVASLQSYENMQLAGIRPNAVTFVSILAACSHAGLVQKGSEYFESMSRDHGTTPEVEHYVCMVDLFGRAGRFTQIEALLSKMPMQPDLALWLCLLNACRKHGKVAIGEHAFSCAVHLDTEHAAAYVLMANIYADAGLIDCATKLRQRRALWKKPGQSWIEHGHEVHAFLAGDLGQ